MDVGRVILAVDAFAEDDVLARKMIRLVAAFAKTRKVSVEPVYVINPEDLTLAGIFEGRVNEFKKAVEEQIYTQLKGVKLPGCGPRLSFSLQLYPRVEPCRRCFRTLRKWVAS